jgi:Spy/CpxP family protein refolding chaperone
MNFFTKNRILVGALILMAAINIAMLATIGFHHIPPKKDLRVDPATPGKHMKMVSKELNLTEEQEIVFENLRKEYANENQVIRRQLRENYRKIMKELSAPSPNKQFLDSMAITIGNLHVEQQQATIKHFLTLREICTTEQYEKLQVFFKRMMSRDQMQRQEMQQRNRMVRKRIKNTAE